MRYSDLMRRFRPLLLLFVLGCAAPEKYRAYSEAGQTTETRRESDLQKNLRDGRSWDEQEQILSDVRNAFGKPSNADATGPKK